MTGPIIGIDIGSQGAIGLLTPTGDLIEVRDMPVLLDGPKGRPNVSAALLADIVVNMKAATAYVEFVSARPGEGAVGAFAFGRSRGVIEGVCGAADVPQSFLTPSHWKRLVGIAPGRLEVPTYIYQLGDFRPVRRQRRSKDRVDPPRDGAGRGNPFRANRGNSRSD
jgi:hypothetical protein